MTLKNEALTSGDECSCSSHVHEQNQLQQEASAATASRDHRQLAKPEQEAGTAAAAGQVHHQPEQHAGTPASASLILQQEDSEIRVLEGMSDRPGRYTELSQRRTEENVALNGGKSSNKTLDLKQFFLTVAKNLEDRMLSEGGRLPD